MQALRMERRISWEAVAAALIAGLGWVYTAGQYHAHVDQQERDQQEISRRLSALESQMRALQDDDRKRFAPCVKEPGENASTDGRRSKLHS